MIDSGVEPGGQPGLEARRRPGWLGLAACGAALPCFPALPGRMLTPGDTECLPPRCRPSAWPLPPLLLTFMDKSNDKPEYKGPIEAVYAGHLQRHKLGRQHNEGMGVEETLNSIPSYKIPSSGC